MENRDREEEESRSWMGKRMYKIQQLKYKTRDFEDEDKVRILRSTKDVLQRRRGM